MRAIRLAVLPALGLALLGQGMAAQVSPVQDSTLRGLGRVHVTFLNSNQALAPAVYASSVEFVDLELRKAGLRLVQDVSELDMTRDADITVQVNKISRALSTDVAIWVSVNEQVTIVRTGQTLPVVTWLYQDDRRNVVPDQVMQPMLRQAVDTFLNAWLTANGR